MIKVGITGGIGSGKTTVCKIFESLGIPVYYADDRAKQLMSFNKKLKEDIKAFFGDQVYHKNGRLNRKVMASIVFNDKSKLQYLNSLVHPAVFEDGEHWFKSISSPYNYAIKEAALMIESGSHLQLDKLILVTAPEEIRIARVVKRDKSKKEQVIKRIKAQMPENEKVPYAQYIIDNSGLEKSLIQQILHIHYQLSNSKS